MKQYNKSKPSKWGYKVFVISESNTGYCLEWKMYTGKHDEFPEDSLSKTHQLVMNMMENYFGIGHIVYMDSFYNSPALARSLAANQVGVCGTVNVNRKEMPRQLKPVHTILKKNDPPVYMKSENVLVCAWHDTKRLHMISTVHNTGCIDKEVNDKKGEDGKRLVQKPFCTNEYNKHMGGVDLLDQRTKTYLYPHPSIKWYMRIFDMLMSVAIVNAHILYKQSATKPMPLDKFVMKLVHSYIKFRSVKCPEQENQGLGHYPFIVDKQKRRECVICKESGKRQQVYYSCAECNYTYLCAFPCFGIFHRRLFNATDE